MALMHTTRRRLAASITAAVAAVALATGYGSAAPTAAQAEGPLILHAGDPDAIQDRYVVILKGSAGFRAGSLEGMRLAARYGAKVHRTFGYALNGYAISLPASEARRFAADPAVAMIEQDLRVRSSATQTNPPWGLDRIDQPRLPLNRAYTYPDTAGNRSTVYVIDSGVRVTHRQLTGRASNGYDFIDNDTTAQDGTGHGTHVATIVAGTTYGVAKAAKIVAVRVLDNSGSGSSSGAIAGVDWVTARRTPLSVANMSLGGSPSTALDRAVTNSIAAGVTYVVAAGNSNTNATDISPARIPAALTVGATTSTDARAAFSNYGASLDLFAPGTSILAGWHTSDTATAYLSGTSMAGPHVAGAAAIHLTNHPTATPSLVASALVNGATPGVLTSIGAGSPDRLLRVVP